MILEVKYSNKEIWYHHALDVSRGHNMNVTLDALGRCAFVW
jgi:hypothetical protein